MIKAMVQEMVAQSIKEVMAEVHDNMVDALAEIRKRK